MAIESGLPFRAIYLCTYLVGAVMQLVGIGYAVIQNSFIIMLPFSNAIYLSTCFVVGALRHEMFFHAVRVLFSMK